MLHECPLLLFHKGVGDIFGGGTFLGTFLTRVPSSWLDGGGPSVPLTDRNHRRTDKEAREMICRLHSCFMVWVCLAVRIFSARAMGESGKVNPLGLPISSTEAELKYTFPTNPTFVLEIWVVVRIYRQQNLEGSSLLSSCRMEHYFDHNLSL